MSYSTSQPLASIDGSDSYKNDKGNHECVVLVQKLTNAPQTKIWKKGKKVMDCSAAEISPGTVIATFDNLGNYPADARHAAIYESHDATGIKVVDQWNAQGKAKRRKIFVRNSQKRAVNDANWYFVVD